MQGHSGVITSHSSDLYRYGTALNKLYDYHPVDCPLFDMGIGGYDPVSAHDVGLSVNGPMRSGQYNV